MSRRLDHRLIRCAQRSKESVLVCNVKEWFDVHHICQYRNRTAQSESAATVKPRLMPAHQQDIIYYPNLNVYAQIRQSKHLKTRLSSCIRETIINGGSKTRGLLKTNRLPFGIHSNPSTFQSITENVIAAIPKTSFSLNDILITECTTEKHLKSLELAHDHLKDCGYGSRKARCLAPLAKKIHPTLKSLQPRNKNELKYFVDTVVFKILPNHFESIQPFTLACDASEYSVRAALSQRRNYAQVDKKELATLFGVRRSQHFIFGQPFDIYTNKKLLFQILRENKSMRQVNLTPDAISSLSLQGVLVHITEPAEVINY
ncbi:hypothetical protein X801_05801 [Opisthorchis viverrini]|uniref:Reverse transcriptase/retrotransposon-derived protein RNase H-like domain-containing protein n=1 Tax=Opisthorchis viverrini TaxID=6198 RepID=A0A1S8WV21_OPIVI|nr:hypothetical protein X801_05801 [Opisthorchis viverrini]